MTVAWRLRAAVLALAGELALHQGRYLLAPQADDHELAGVHRYLVWLMPLAAALLFLALAQFAASLRRLDLELDPGRLAELPPMRTLWLAASVSLLTAFGAQETVELRVVHGQLPLLSELAGHAGWQALPLAVAIGAVVALLLRGAARVARWILAREPRPATSRPAPGPRPAAHLDPRREHVLARFLAGRAPPSCSSRLDVTRLGRVATAASAAPAGRSGA